MDRRDAAARSLKNISTAILLASAGFTLIVATRGEAPAQAAPAPAPAPATIAFGPTPPTDIANPADPTQAATFAWQEFIALTWPAKPNPDISSSGYFRGRPDPTAASGSTGPSGVTVWETYYHRAELYPGYTNATGNTLPDPNAPPSYLYPFVTINAAPGASQTLFNNADEASEISIANMYYTPLAKKTDALRAAGAPAAQIAAAAAKAAIVYEAKGNGVIFNYLKQTGFNNIGTAASGMTPGTGRTQALANSILKITNKPYQGPAFELPTGSIEIKATWRRYDSTADDLSKFHSAKLIYYTGPDNNGNYTAYNDTFLLISLHIIQKTPNVPTFTFATFEHVSNETNGFRFTNVGPQTCVMGQSNCPAKVPRSLPDPGIITAIRQFPIPAALKTFNTNVQNQIRAQYGPTNVWANYQLIGVQAVVQDDPGGTVPKQQFFLSNFATETNDTLQFFQGGLSGPGSDVPDPDLPRVFKRFTDPVKKTTSFRGYTAGGCVGCHGAAGQFQGGDFSVIAATGNFFQPQGITPYPVGTPVNQNSTGFPLPHQASAGSGRPAPKKGL
ncbi:MAG TPA: hypothetical protein VE053_03740 [Allosphingosinicella sp.]|nr:hypothetical protein [Allosphingosinicella sp.]